MRRSRGVAHVVDTVIWKRLGQNRNQRTSEAQHGVLAQHSLPHMPTAPSRSASQETAPRSHSMLNASPADSSVREVSFRVTPERPSLRAPATSTAVVAAAVL